jgi:hypothetical protein
VPSHKQKIAPRRFKRIGLAELRQGRRGKHHDTVMPIVEEIATLPDSEAIEIPLRAVNLPLTNLRSAVVKAAASRGLKVATYSDKTTLYVWRRTAASQAYERAGRGRAKPTSFQRRTS